MICALNTAIHVYRLAEEVEKRTSVQSSGMQGFYSNLLTKNIAFGGDVGQSATSAYTVGSMRQTTVLDEHDVSATDVAAVSETSCSSSTAVCHTLPTIYADVSQKFVSDEALAINPSKTNKPEESMEQSKRIRLAEESDGGKVQTIHTPTSEEESDQSKTLVQSSFVINTAAQNKDDVVMSARERYLARKNKNN